MCIKYTHQEIVNQLEKKNIKLLDLYKGRAYKNKLMCLKCLHKWQANTRSGCPNCAGIVKLTIDEIDKRLELKGILRKSEYFNMKSAMNFKCLKCNHLWTTRAGAPSVAITMVALHVVVV